MSKPTRGPWRIDGRYVLALKAKVVAEIPMGGVIHGKVDAANAALIAAAPALYAALEAFTKLSGASVDGGKTWRYYIDERLMQRARAALKAAAPTQEGRADE